MSQDIDTVLDRTLITAMFERMSDEAQKEVLAAVHEMLDRQTYDEVSNLDYDQQVERLELLREQLNQRLPESREWSREYLLKHY